MPPVYHDLIEENRRLRESNAEMLAALRKILHYETTRDPNRGALAAGALSAVEIAIAHAETLDV